jgi:hypothetical protein
MDDSLADFRACIPRTLHNQVLHLDSEMWDHKRRRPRGPETAARQNKSRGSPSTGQKPPATLVLLSLQAQRHLAIASELRTKAAGSETLHTKSNSEELHWATSVRVQYQTLLSFSSAAESSISGIPNGRAQVRYIRKILTPKFKTGACRHCGNSRKIAATGRGTEHSPLTHLQVPGNEAKATQRRSTSSCLSSNGGEVSPLCDSPI